MSDKTVKDYEKDYTDPKLRESLKEKIKANDKGGKAGQWTARKAQLLVKEYEAHGGEYKHSGKRTKKQDSLRQWSKKESEEK